MSLRSIASEFLKANAVVASILGSIPASSNTVESEGRGRQVKAVMNKELEKSKKYPC